MTSTANRDAMRVTRRPRSQFAFFGISGVLFATSAAVTITWCASMAAMGGMPMPGDWTMSMAWMRMPGQTWPGAALVFLGMWIVMMVAMMLPSLAPMLWRYYLALAATGAAPAGRLTVHVGASYFSLWAVLGLAAFSVGASLAEIEMAHPAVARLVPIATGVVVLLAGAFQFSTCKMRWLSRCQSSRAHDYGSINVPGAWRYGLQLGLRCSVCCAGLTAILLVMGVMDLRVMTVVTAAVTAERLAPQGLLVARMMGAAALAIGAFLIVRGAA